MDISKAKFIVGEASKGNVATIRLFDSVDWWSKGDFLREFEYLTNCVQPKLIRVLINSDGGSVMHGMSIFSAIQSCEIPTECIVEGIAASMASIIWAAGDKSLMRDYSILMIHNPFCSLDDDSDAEDMVKAFTEQIKTIYSKRFGLDEETVKNIMDGESGKDGTFFNATQAVELGIIPAENIIETNQQTRDVVNNMLSGVNDSGKIRNILEGVNAVLDIKKLDKSGFNKGDKVINLKTMSTEKSNVVSMEAVTATLGLKGDAEIKDVISRINSLKAVEAQLEEANKNLADMKTVVAGKEAAIDNLQKDLDKVNDSLKVYKDKEVEDFNNKVESTIEAAVEAGKITAEAKEGWITMAKENFELVESTLSSIPAREKISEAIGKDKDNAEAMKDAMKDVNAIMAKKVTAVVGENFEFKSLK